MTKECTFEEFCAATPGMKEAIDYANRMNSERVAAEVAEIKRQRRNKARRERDQAMRDLGLVKVRGNLGGTYWE